MFKGLRKAHFLSYSPNPMAKGKVTLHTCTSEESLTNIPFRSVGLYQAFPVYEIALQRLTFDLFWRCLQWGTSSHVVLRTVCYDVSPQLTFSVATFPSAYPHNQTSICKRKATLFYSVFYSETSAGHTLAHLWQSRDSKVRWGEDEEYLISGFCMGVLADWCAIFDLPFNRQTRWFS